MFPIALGTIEHTALTLPHGTVMVPVAHPRFMPWTGDRDRIHTFGGKELLCVDDRPQFAEVAILRAFEAEVWQGRWLETYGKGAMSPGLWTAWHPDGPSAQSHVPIAEPWVSERLHAIAQANGGTYSGCWDVVAWKHGRLVFAESKKQKKDRLRGTQLRWMEAALRCGCAVEDFLVVEWMS